MALEQRMSRTSGRNSLSEPSKRFYQEKPYSRLRMNELEKRLAPLEACEIHSQTAAHNHSATPYIQFLHSFHDFGESAPPTVRVIQDSRIEEKHEVDSDNPNYRTYKRFFAEYFQRMVLGSAK